ncbi:MAG: FKBP-type peptidyl-prolyl cis-trans isomerase [Planctomycetes bacterium]|nr:FKBP-type peptidyl-prolyl cis-trans isomerase [Planctomycetota bacterium]
MTRRNRRRTCLAGLALFPIAVVGGCGRSSDEPAAGSAQPEVSAALEPAGQEVRDAARAGAVPPEADPATSDREDAAREAAVPSLAGETGEAPASRRRAEPARAEAALLVEDLRIGDGEPVAAGAEVSIHFTGTLLDGSRWAASRGGEPLRLRIGDASLIRGLSQGLVGMRPGGARRITAAGALAYGQRGLKESATGLYAVPPGATVVLEVELIEVSRS